MTALVLVSSLRPGGDASHARAAAAHLARAGNSVSVHALDWERPADPLPLWNLNAVLNEQRPERIHCVGLPALRCLASVRPTTLARTWAARLKPFRNDWTPPDRVILHQTRGAIAETTWEANLLEKQGFRDTRLAHQPLTLDEEFFAPLASDPNPPPYPFLVNLSRLEHVHSPRDALWTMDMLAYVFPEMRLHLIGEGSLADTLRPLTQRVHYQGRTRLLAPVADVRPHLGAARICWITARPGHGLRVALEAQACGCPVVAYDQPALREIVTDGKTGFLVKPGDMVALGRKTFVLLKEEGIRLEMSAACKKQARAFCPLTPMKKDRAGTRLHRVA